jgi:hypothetical protein
LLARHHRAAFSNPHASPHEADGVGRTLLHSAAERGFYGVALTLDGVLGSGIRVFRRLLRGDSENGR